MSPNDEKISRRKFLGVAGAAGAGVALGALPESVLAEPQARMKRRVLIIAGTPSHGPGSHEFNAGCSLLHKCLGGVKTVEPLLSTNGWPKDAAMLENLAAIIMYMDGGGGHIGLKDNHLEILMEQAKKGVGIGCMHYAVEVPKERGGKEWQEMIGGYYETNFSCNPMWQPDFKTFPNHTVARGVKPFSVKDEWYFNMRFVPDMKGVTPILVAKPSDEVRNGPYVSPRGPYPHIQEAKGRDEIMLWVKERDGGGRGFGFTGGHFHQNWANEEFRKVVLNAIVWTAKAGVPKEGVASSLTEDDMKANLDKKG